MIENLMKYWRLRRNMTLAELAEKSGVSIATIHRIENGSVEFAKVGTLLKISNALGVSIENIFFVKVFDGQTEE